MQMLQGPIAYDKQNLDIGKNWMAKSAPVGMLHVHTIRVWTVASYYKYSTDLFLGRIYAKD